MKKVLFILLLTIVKAMAFSQTFYSIEGGKTLQTKYAPYLGLGAGYKANIYTFEGGLKTNYNNYYTLLFLSSGIESKGKFLVGVNGGIGFTLNIPQLDRRYDPETHETTVISEGYETNCKVSYYLNGKLGYEILRGFKPYVSYSYSWGLSWVSAGIKLSIVNE